MSETSANGLSDAEIARINTEHLISTPLRPADLLFVFGTRRGVGETIAFAESREACMPFYPEKRVPIDAYNAAILDHVKVELEL